MNCPQWAVVTTIHAPDESIIGISNLSKWCLAIIGDNITPDNAYGDLAKKDNIFHLGLTPVPSAPETEECAFACLTPLAWMWLPPAAFQLRPLALDTRPIFDRRTRWLSLDFPGCFHQSVERWWVGAGVNISPLLAHLLAFASAVPFFCHLGAVRLLNRARLLRCTSRV